VAMSAITKTRANIMVSYMEVRFTSGTTTLGYQGAVELVFDAVNKLDPYGRLTTIGYMMRCQFTMLQNDKTALHGLAGYIKDDTPAAVNVYGYTIGASDGFVQITNIKAVFSFAFRALESSPINVQFSKALSITDFHTIFKTS